MSFWSVAVDDLAVPLVARARIRQAEVGAGKTMVERTEVRFDIKPERLAADTAYGSGPNLNWLVKDKDIAPHIPVIDKSKREDGSLSREDDVMKKLALLTLAAATLFATAGAASAQYYPGTGFGIQIGPRYDRDYDEERYYRRDRERYRYDQRRYYRRGGPCPRGYTVQDGVCKPYRGY